MKRFALDFLAQWRERPDRKPLVIRGARQVGKTELVRIFARQAFDSIVEINFDENPEKASLFDEPDVLTILRLIETDASEKIVPGKTLLFLDEIQGAPAVLAKLRYFYEKLPELHVIAAGSLFDFSLGAPEYSVPVGRIEFMYLGPMSFEEFLLARGQEKLREYLAEFKISDRMPEALHAKARAYLREYFLVGGLPGVVKAFIESDLDMKAVSRAQNSLLQTYYADFSTYKRKADVPMLQAVFKNIPATIGTTVKYSRLNPLARSIQVRESLDLLEKARLAFRVFHSDGNGIPLGAEIHPSSFKLIFLDIGLLASFLGLNAADFPRDKEMTLVNSGAMAEQFIGQHLLYRKELYREPSLFYWNRQSKGSTAEVDYLIQAGNRVIPVEVKAGKTGRLRSLQVFIQEKKASLGLRFNDDVPSVVDARASI
ncbi:MAG: AAA family ATPase, partial [Rectinemataceae bacterium]|nr:AAA family ATPase [Rectinemataceae bacterium]